MDVHIDLANNEHLSPKYLLINDNGVVPTLVNDENIIKDSNVICEDTDEVFSELANGQSLTPEDPIKKAEMRSWMRLIEKVPTPSVRVPSFNMAFLSRFKGLLLSQFHDQQSDIRPLRKEFYGRMGPKGFDSEDFESAIEKLQTTTKRMELSLKKGPWLIGRSYSIADIILAPLLDRMDNLSFTKIWIHNCPNVVTWFKCIRSRLAFQQALYKGTRLSELHNLWGRVTTRVFSY